MIGYLVDVENDRAGLVEIRDGDHLRQFYDLIGCECIDIAVRSVGGKHYNVVLDDEGLLKDGYKVSGTDENMRLMLAGNIILFGIGEDGDLVSIDDADPQNIKANMYKLVDFDTMTMHPSGVHGLLAIQYSGGVDAFLSLRVGFGRPVFCASEPTRADLRPLHPAS